MGEGEERMDKLKEMEGVMDSLLLDPFQPIDQEEIVVTKQEKPKILTNLKPEHQEKARNLAAQIKLDNQHAIIQYGIAAQSELSKFSNSVLHHIQTKDAGPVGEVIHDLMGKLSGLNPDELMDGKQGWLKRVFKSTTDTLQQLLGKYQKLGTEIDRIADQLEKHRQMLFRDTVMLETLYEKNRDYFEALNIYIAAAELRIEQLQQNDIPMLEKRVEISNDQMEVQKLNDVLQFVERLEKRIYDLKLSRQITLQTAPQIRMIQNVNQTLVERIQSSIVTAIPLWKNQVIIAITLFRQQKSVEAQKQVAKTTNELLLKNSELLKQNSIETARENERGVVDIETLKKTQENLMITLQETLKIQQEGRMKRMQAETELIQMEGQLKTQLLELRNK